MARLSRSTSLQQPTAQLQASTVVGAKGKSLEPCDCQGKIRTLLPARGPAQPVEAGREGPILPQARRLLLTWSSPSLSGLQLSTATQGSLVLLHRRQTLNFSSCAFDVDQRPVGRAVVQAAIYEGHVREVARRKHGHTGWSAGFIVCRVIPEAGQAVGMHFQLHAAPWILEGRLHPLQQSSLALCTL